ncbi:malectin domain-containing carbohydrate-binding protein [Jatrophihabitans lederbergiae]|uniref:Malectin domain-containing carbohydrate-binding protein n=1 Tax=Jatrophihabitans lederbergiae TaxID=3075547 RepID=A0ABU2J5K9_9ACTN|nr:malectin domain-containing carbohydrate-binding protein [Jatrophihabitans sp. DSM 44399]MDT0260280.1 malectin domain-containing carbohydrate-binding protein [Jatrophihabitans sp. DSM 44399]
MYAFRLTSRSNFIAVTGCLLATTAILTHAGTSVAAVTAVRPTSAHLVAAGRAVTDRSGQVWSTDSGFAVGGTLSTTSQSILGTTEPKLFQTQRYGMSGFKIPLAAGTYQVTVNLAEHYWPKARQRIFSISAEGHTVASGVDAVAEVGEFHAYQLRFSVPVSDGTLDLRFTAQIDHSMLSSVSAVLSNSAPVTSAPVSLAAPVTSAAPVRTVPVSLPADAMRPESFGARGDGSTDDTAALQKAFDSAPAGVPVYLTPGRSYPHATVLHLRVPGLHVTGAGVLLATSESRSSVWIESDNVLLDGGVVIRTARTTQRWSAWEQMGVRVVGHRGVVLRGIVVDGSAAAGIYIGNQASQFVLDQVTVRNTRADGIHMTMGAHDGQVISPTVANTGDDGVAVVSYASDGPACHDITVKAPRVLGTTWGRGLSVVGGTRITETDIDVERTSAAGVYVASEGSPWYTAAPQSVSIAGGSISDANTDAGVDHGAVLVMSGAVGHAPDAVTIRGLAISSTRASASRDIGVVTYGTAPKSILFADLAITGGPKSAYQGNTPQTSYQVRNLTQNGIRLADRG